MMFIGFIIIALIIYMFVSENPKFIRNSSKNAVERLNERLAKGEISIEEYRDLKNLIDN